MTKPLRRTMLQTIAGCLLLLLTPTWYAWAADFGFIVMGDTRSEPFLPGGAEQADQILQVLKSRFGQTAQLDFDSRTGELSRVTLPAKGNRPETIYVYREGWPHLAQVGGQVFLRRSGQEWLYRRVVAELLRRNEPPGPGPQFVIHTGDLPLWGQQGVGYDQSPDYQDFYDRLLRWLPPTPPGLGLKGRLFLALGNHETWGDEDLTGLFTTLPHLSRLGMSPQRRIYAFDHQGCRFIFLDSGPYQGDKEGWFSQHPGFKQQMQALTAWLKEAETQKMRQVFVTYHKPSFCLAGHGPLPPDQNPHPYLKPFARRLNLTVFNGHVHTTEVYLADGIRYLLLGAGGAPQVFQAQEPPPEHPAELYWKGSARVEEYSYLRATVIGSKLGLRLHRFRPGQPLQPFQTLDLFVP